MGEDANKDCGGFLVKEEYTEFSRDASLSPQVQTFFTVFLINCFQSLEQPLVRQECLRLVSLSTWVRTTSFARRVG